MANVAKYTRGACGHLMKHYERAKDENGEYVKFHNQDIDPARTHLNYNLAPDRNVSQWGFVKQRCEDVYCCKRSDVNVMCSWVITAPKDFLEAHPELEERFFQESYDFLENRYGKDNVISAYVHRDENTPHMHFAFVPVTHDKKKQRDKVSAFEVITRNELKTFHKALESHLEQRLGCKVNILNEATKDGNKSIDELKRETAQKQLKKLQKELQEAQRKLSGVEFDCQHALFRKNALEGEIERLRAAAELEVQERLEAADKVAARAGQLQRAAEEKLQSANQEAAAVLKDANEKATGMTTVAKVKANQILQNAETQAAQIRAAATPDQIRKLQKENSDLRDTIAYLKGRCAAAEESNQLYEAVIESSPELLGHYKQAQDAFLRKGGTIQKPGR